MNIVIYLWKRRTLETHPKLIFVVKITQTAFSSCPTGLCFIDCDTEMICKITLYVVYLTFSLVFKILPVQAIL